MPMHKFLLVAILAIINLTSYAAADDTDNATLVKTPKTGHRAAQAIDEDLGGEPPSEASDDVRVLVPPDEIGPRRRPECCFPGLSCRPCPCLYGEVEALFLERVPLYQNRPIVVDANTGATFVSTSDLDSGFEPGLRAMLGMRLCNGLAVEFGFLASSQDGFTLTEKPSDTSYLIFSNNLAGNVFVNMDRVQANYSSSLNSFELNFPCCCGCWASCGCGETVCNECGRAKPARSGACCGSLEWFAGIRYLDIDDKLNIGVERRENGGVEDGSYSIQASNHLIGGQIGARLRRTTNRFGWEVTGKAGVYANEAEQTQSVTDFPNFALRPTTSAAGSNAAFVGEINVSGIYRLTDHWSVKAGYNAIWIEGLALAPDQLDFNFATSPSGNQLHASGGMLLHGVNLGLEARW